MVILEGCTGWMPFLASLVFTVEKVYFDENVFEYHIFYRRCITGHQFLMYLIGNGHKIKLTVGLDKAQLVF